LFSFLGVTLRVPFSAAKLVTHPVSKEINDVTASQIWASITVHGSDHPRWNQV